MSNDKCKKSCQSFNPINHGSDNNSWGRGTIKIINACKEAKLPEPEIIEKDGGVEVTIFKPDSSSISDGIRKEFG